MHQIMAAGEILEKIDASQIIFFIIGSALIEVAIKSRRSPAWKGAEDIFVFIH